MSERLPFVPYPPIEKHGLIGDRRTAALVAADGTINWLCLPDYDGKSLFGSLLDSRRGGYWRLGPERLELGQQRYIHDTAVLETIWKTDQSELELTDWMAYPQDERPEGGEDGRTVVRRLRCLRGQVACEMGIRPRDGFDGASMVSRAADGLEIRMGNLTLGLWSSLPLETDSDRAGAKFTLGRGEEMWAVLSSGDSPVRWTEDRARRTLTKTSLYWNECLDKLNCSGRGADRLRRSMLVIYLLSYAPTGSLVAAPTTSLPERIGGGRNYDYRYAWVRDASLSMAMLALLGDTARAEYYMGWLARRDSSTDSPLQVVYRISGETDLTQEERNDLEGYRESTPVRFGNHAATQRQLDSLGYLAECALVYLEEGSAWYEECWQTVRAAAEYTAANWQKPDSGIWELPVEGHYVSSKVMGWVTLDRAIKIAERTDRLDETSGWQDAMESIHAEVMDRGWSDRLGAFRQRYDADNLDASALLIPIMNFLPPDHPRVVSTVERIEESLAIEGFVHRFIARETPGHEDLPLGEFEGAFLPCTFWLAAAYAKGGNISRAESILTRAEALAGELGLFAEEVDARTGAFLGNTPLLFSQVEYVRAVLELNKARSNTRAVG